MESFRHMPLENIQNCRDLGGYPIKGGGFTKYGRLLRCGRPRASTPNDMEFFREYGIKNVFDLRGDSEAISMPSEFADYPGVNYYHSSLLEINPASPHMEMSMPEVYVTSLNECKGNYARLFSALSRVDAPSMFHCFLGKDRTGITAALILHLTGVYFEDIVADYRISSTYLEPFYRREMERKTGLVHESDMAHLGSPSENITAVFEYLSRRYGSVEDYFLSAGLTSDEVDAVGRILR